MKVVYAILTAVGWAWLVAVAAFVWLRLRREPRQAPGPRSAAAPKGEPAAVAGPPERRGEA